MKKKNDFYFRPFLISTTDCGRSKVHQVIPAKTILEHEFNQRFGPLTYFDSSQKHNNHAPPPPPHFEPSSSDVNFNQKVDLGQNPQFSYAGIEDNVHNLPPLPPGEFYQYDDDELQAPPLLSQEALKERQSQILQCHIRFCEQRIIGRELTYDRSLQIVQDEEYLSAVDQNIVRHRRVKRQSNTFTIFGNDYAIDSNFTGEFDLRVIPLAILLGVAYVITVMGMSDETLALGSDTPIGPQTTTDPRLLIFPPPGVAPTSSIQPDDPFGGASPGNADPNDLAVACRSFLLEQPRSRYFLRLHRLVRYRQFA